MVCFTESRVVNAAARTVSPSIRCTFAREVDTAGAAIPDIDERFVRPVEALPLVGDASKAKRVLGWEPTVGFREMCGRWCGARWRGWGARAPGDGPTNLPDALAALP